MSTAIARNFQIGIDPTPANNFTLYQPATPDGTLRLGNGNTGITSSLLTLTSAGNLGLGVTPSAWGTSGNILRAFEGFGGSFVASQSGLAASFVGTACYYDGSVWRYKATGTVPSYALQFGGAHQWFTAPSGTAGNAISFTQAMTLDANGRLGIGTTTVSDRLTLGGGRIKIESSPVSQFIGNDGTDTALQLAADFIKFQTGGSYIERARIASNGDFLINWTATTTARFVVRGVNTSFNNCASFINNNGDQSLDVMAGFQMTNGTPQGVAVNNVMTLRSSGGSSGVIAFATGNTEAARVDTGGNLLVGATSLGTIGSTPGSGLFGAGYVAGCVANDTPGLFSRRSSDGGVISFRRDTTQVGTVSVTTTSTAYNTSSDYRLKENIQPMVGALARVASLKPCTYTWKANGSDGEGFIAHELAEVCPHAVSGEKDAVDADGNPVYQGIDTSFLVATLTAAIQELKAEFDAYKATHP